MRQAIVVLTAFLLVLTAGAAFALMISGDSAVETATESPTTTSAHEVTSAPDSAGSDGEQSGKSAGAGSDDEKSGEKDSGGEKAKKKASDQEEADGAEPTKRAKALELTVLSPKQDTHFTHDHVAFEGEVTPGSKVFAGKWEADVSDDGHWRIVLILAGGKNTVVFTAAKKGKEAHDQVTVYLDAKSENDQVLDFTAHQKYGSCDSEVPYDVWYGTGEPGTKIFIASEYGSADGSIGESGKWEVKVKFPNAPCGKEFKVVLETNKGHRKVYEFVRLCQKDHDGGDGGRGEK